jgi:hypothetical protein
MKRQIRLERWLLQPFGLFALFEGALELYNHDWWAAGIFGMAVILCGGIGQGLPKNRKKSFRELCNGPDADPPDEEIVNTTNSGVELAVSNALLGFSLLAVATWVALAIHFGSAWWIVLAVAFVLWIGVVLIGAIVTL